jgi:hypothetical protein
MLVGTMRHALAACLCLLGANFLLILEFVTPRFSGLYYSDCQKNQHYQRPLFPTMYRYDASARSVSVKHPTGNLYEKWQTLFVFRGNDINATTHPPKKTPHKRGTIHEASTFVSPKKSAPHERTVRTGTQFAPMQRGSVTGC